MDVEVLIVMAMGEEAEPLIERLGLRAAEGFTTRSGRTLPMRAWQGSMGRDVPRDVALVTCGVDDRFGVDAIGTLPAALAAHEGIERYAPGLVISAGTAGGFAARGAATGDVYVSEAPVVYHDRRIAIPGFDEYGIGSYPCIDAGALAEELGLKRGLVSTGNALDLPPCDRAMMERTGATVKDMEAAAVAWICLLHGVPFLAVKAITDLIDGAHPPEAEFLENLRMASEALTEAMVKVLERQLTVDS